ncbi:MAG TPA: PAS domain S-box protein [Anaerolineales bacterium]|nr:PAS domain S-box protein [Anaerolineales bacterium]
MKRITAISILAIVVLFTSPVSKGTSALSMAADPIDADTSIAPGSIVRFEHLTIEDGLSQNAGLTFFQDSKGYLWIGSQDGLNRYDGYDFKVFKQDPDDPDSISHNSILAITQDKDGYLWIGTWGGGLNRFDPATETFVHYLHNSNEPNSLSSDTVTSIKQDSTGALWVGTIGGLNRYNPLTNGFDHFKNDPKDPNSLSGDAISVIFEDSHHQLWIGTGAIGMEGSGLNRFDPTTGKVVRYQHNNSASQSLSSNNIASIYESSDGTFWIATGGFSLQGNGLNQFDPRTGTARYFSNNPESADSLGANNLMALWGDSSGVLWIGTWAAGLDRMELSNPGHFVHYQNDRFFPDSLSGNEIWSLYKDHSGVLWVGTSHSGINKLPANSGQFSLYRNNPSDSSSLSTNAVGAFSEDRRGDIWIATWGAGLDRFNLRTGRFDHFRHDPEDPDSLSDDLFMAVYVDAYDLVWAGTLGKGLDRLTPTNGKVVHYLHDPENPASIADDNIAVIIPDQAYGLWIGTFGGLSHFDLSTNTFTNYSHDPANPASLSDNRVVSLYLDSKKNILWIGTWGGGLNQLDLNNPLYTDPQRATLIRYHHNPADPSSLSEDSVWAIHQTMDGALWLGTQMGLNRFDPNTRTFRRYTEQNGLPNNVVLGVLEDHFGKLWITTNNGLAKFDPDTKTFIAYDTSDGLQSNEFNSNAYYRTRKGNLLVGGVNGFNLFDPANINANPIAPQVAITGFEVFNEPLQMDLSGREPIQLSYKQSFISFEFAAFDFQAPHKNQYAYKLEGFDKDWVQAGNRRFATYTNLPGGEYVFRVKASNSDNVWNEKGAALPVFITPPIWRTWWFNGSLIFVLGVLIAGGFRWRLASIREQNIHLETEIAERTSELRETNRLLEKEVEQRKRAEAELEKRAAEELHESEARFQTIFNDAAVGVGMMGLDRKVLDANPAICRMFGRTHEEMIGLDAAEATFPEDDPESAKLFQELISGERDSYEVNRRYIRKNGDVFWAHVTMSAVRKADNSQPLFLVGMVIDISEQKKMEDRIRESQARFQAVFDNVAVGVAVMGLDRRPIAFNAAAGSMIGYSAAELQDVDARSLAVPEDRQIDDGVFGELIEGKRNSYTMERRYRRKDGRVFWARVNYSLVHDLDGNPDYLIGMIEDIDDQKRAAQRLAEQEAEYLLTLQQRVTERTQELEDANQRLQKEIEHRTKIEKELAERAADEAVTADRTRLARDLHDAVTQTLFSASLIAEVLPDLWDMDVDEAKNSTEELRQLTRGALAEMRTLLLELRPAALTQTRLHDLIKQLCEAFIGRSRLPITLNIEGERQLPPEVQVAFYRIAQESLNNVFKYARATKVNVTLSLSASEVRFEVCDNGLGFDTSTAKPTSLGLRIMRERAEAIGADLYISSTPGSGTCVELRWCEKPNLKLHVL